MCNQNNDCDYEGEMYTAYGSKDVYVYCIETDKDYRIPHRITVQVCPKCSLPDWQTLC